MCEKKALKQRQPRQKQKEEEGEEESDDEDKHVTDKVGKLSTIEKRMLTICKTLKKSCEKTQNEVATDEECEKVKKMDHLQFNCFSIQNHSPRLLNIYFIFHF